MLPCDRYDTFEAGSGTSLWTCQIPVGAQVKAEIFGYRFRICQDDDDYESGESEEEVTCSSNNSMVCGFDMISLGGGNALKFVNMAKDEIPQALTAMATEAHSEARPKSMQLYICLETRCMLI